MRLDQYVWSRNPRGLHVQRALITPLLVERWTNAGFGWVKLVAAGEEYVDDSMRFLERGVTPVLRLYRERWGARPFDRTMRDQTLSYLRAGVKWFEFYNEPNLPIEWPPGVNIDFRNMDIMIPLIENWLLWAEFIVSQGGYPGFTALAETPHPQQASIRWIDVWLNHLAENHYERFRYVLANGAYCATHPYILNHYYQRVPGGGPTSARPPEQQVAREPGWHFEYPYDPISQASDPGRTVYGGTALTPYGDPNGLTAMGRMFNERCAAMFGTQAVPVVGTEGGIWPFNDAPLYQPDDRYPPYTQVSQGIATVAMFDWIAMEAQPWMFGVCLWKEDDYYNPDKVPAILRLEEYAPLYRNVPQLEVMGSGYTPPDLSALPGPGPIHGRADFHIMLIAPGIDPNWFFETAREYWESFRPIVTTDVALIDYITSDFSLAVTLITPPDQVEAFSRRIEEPYPNVWLDIIITTEPQDISDILDRRVRNNQRLG